MIIKKFIPYKRKKAFLLVARTIIIVIAGSFAFFFLTRSITQVTEKILNARNNFTALTAQYSALDQSQKDYEAVQGKTEKLEAMFLTLDTVPVIEDFLQGVARKINTPLVLSFDYSPKPSEQGMFDEIGISLQIEGGEQTLIDFLRHIESAPYLIAVRAVALEFNILRQNSARVSAVIYLKQNQ